MTAVLIPALNAEKTLPRLLQLILERFVPSQVLIVDDGSNDQTAAVSRAMGVRVLTHSKNLGKGAALRKGLEALLTDPELDSVITMDADLQHSPEDLARFMDAWRMGSADVYVGVRKRRGTAMPLARRMSNSIASWLTTARTGVPILDSQCGYRLIGRKVLESITIESNGFEAETEFLLKAARLGFRIGFVPIQTIYANEKSAMTKWQTTKRFLQMLFREY